MMSTDNSSVDGRADGRQPVPTMKKLLLVLPFLASTSAFAQLRVFTHTAISTNEFWVTNNVVVLNGQAVRVSAFKPISWAGGPSSFCSQVNLLKGGQSWQVVIGDVIQGPATFELWAAPSHPALLSLERWAVPRH